MNEPRILGIGSTLVDAVLPVSDTFLAAHVPGARGGMEFASREEQDRWIHDSGNAPARATGGAAGNTIACLAHLGVKTAHLGKVGADADGDFYRAKLAERGTAALFFVSEKTGSGRCLSLVTPDSERTMRTCLGATGEISVEEVRTVDFSRFSLVYIEGYQLFNAGIVQESLRLAKAAGCRTAMDLASFEVMKIFREDVLNMLGRDIDMVFANEEEAAVLTGPGKSAAEMALELGKRCHVAVVKCGAAGSCIVRDGVLTQIAITPVKALDTTAAGDSWAAGYLYGYCQGWEDARCGEAGSIVSAEIVQVFGSELPQERWDVICKKVAVLQDGK